jgi:putative exosortase-associated protein (TIGR04073 family)
MRTRHCWRFKLVVGTLAIWLLGTSSALAAEGAICKLCANATDEAATYPEKAGNTLVRGAANALFGWTELIRQPVAEVKGGGNVLVGMGKGLGETVRRTLGGAGEVLTFWTPKVQGSYLHFSQDCPVCMGRQQSRR